MSSVISVWVHEEKGKRKDKMTRALGICLQHMAFGRPACCSTNWVVGPTGSKLWVGRSNCVNEQRGNWIWCNEQIAEQSGLSTSQRKSPTHHLSYFFTKSGQGWIQDSNIWISWSPFSTLTLICFRCGERHKLRSVVLVRSCTSPHHSVQRTI